MDLGNGRSHFDHYVQWTTRISDRNSHILGKVARARLASLRSRNSKRIARYPIYAKCYRPEVSSWPHEIPLAYWVQSHREKIRPSRRSRAHIEDGRNLDNGQTFFRHVCRHI